MGSRNVFPKKVQTAGKGPRRIPLLSTRPFGPVLRRCYGRCSLHACGDEAGFFLEVLQVRCGTWLGEASFAHHHRDDVFALHRGGLAVRVGLGEDCACQIGFDDGGRSSSCRCVVDDGFDVGCGFHDVLSFSGCSLSALLPPVDVFIILCFLTLSTVDFHLLFHLLGVFSQPMRSLYAAF